MTISYEINPPKISADQNILNTLFERIDSISTVCDGIHLTDSVLGIPRVSPLNIAKKIRETNQKIIIRTFDLFSLREALQILGLINKHPA